MEKRGWIDGFGLKILMCILMTLDHLYYNLFPRQLLWAHYAARVVAPVFVYLMTVGMAHTRNRARYIGRMFAFGGGMLAVSLVLYIITGEILSNSIIVSLAISAALLDVLDRCIVEHKLGWIVVAVGLCAASLVFEGGYLIPLMAVIFYYLRRWPLVMCGVYVGVFGGMYLAEYLASGYLASQFFMICAVIPILCYNGQRGRGGWWAQYFFYLFYPLHLWIIFFWEILTL